MSWSVRIVAPASPTEYGYVQPWLLSAGDSGGEATLLLHAGPYDVQLDPEDPFSPIWRAGYLPAANSVERSMSVDAASGGDWDQVRPTTILIADQMSDGTSMSEFIAAQGIRLHGAVVELFAGVPAEGQPLPAPYWTGKIVQAQPEDMSIKLTCEPDGDTNPIGEMLDGSTIRPIVIGRARNVPLAVLQDETIYPALTVRGYADFGDRPSKEDAIANGTGAHPYDSELPNFPSLLTPPAEFMFLGDTRRIYLHINAKTESDNQYLDYFPGGVVTSRNWALECISGDGKGGLRHIEMGTGVSVWRGSGSGPHIDGTLPFDPWWNPSPYQTGYISFSLSPFYATYDAWSTIGDFTLFSDPRLTAHYHDNDDARISYLRLVRRDLRIAKPSLATEVKFKFQVDDTYGSYESFGVVDEGDRYLVDLRRHPDASAHLFQRLDIDPSEISTQRIPPEMTGSVTDVFSLAGGELTVTGDFRTLNIGIRRNRDDGSTIVGAIKSAKRIWLSIDASFGGYLRATLKFVGRQSGRNFRRLDLANSWQNEIIPNVLAEASKVFSPENGGLCLLFDWEEGYSSSIPKGTQGGLTLAPPSEIDCIQSIEISLDHAETLDDLSTIYYDRSEYTSDLVIRRLAIHIEREVGIDQTWADIVGPTFLSCPGGIDRPNGMGGTYNSFALERNAWDGIPLSSGLSSDQVIEDHAHTIEALLRIDGHHGDTIDVQSIETAYWDSVCKTRTALAPEPVDQRPKCGFPLTDTAQSGDVYAQLCRDGGLIGGRDARNRRTLKAFLARTWLEEEDHILRDAYDDGTPGDFLRGSVKPGRTTLDDVATSPLIRYAIENGDPTAYIQVLHPEATAYDPAYCIGFANSLDAQRAWEICHKGWQRTGVVHARELTMVSIYDYSSLIKLLMPQRGCGQLEWMVQQKETLAYTISEENAAAVAPDGSRMRLHHWLRAPTGRYGTLVSTTSKRGSDEATQTVILDPVP